MWQGCTEKGILYVAEMCYSYFGIQYGDFIQKIENRKFSGGSMVKISCFLQRAWVQSQAGELSAWHGQKT